MLSFGAVCAIGLWLFDGYKQDQERDKKWALLNCAKDLIVILNILTTDLKDLKVVRLFKLEEDQTFIMAIITFAINDVYMIGLINTLNKD